MTQQTRRFLKKAKTSNFQPRKKKKQSNQTMVTGVVALRRLERSENSDVEETMFVALGKSGGEKNNAVLGRAELCGQEDLRAPHSPT